ncbi:4-hydroxy-tetrahydrodipicolinate reductase [Rhizosaccharibacter radicis]|uniref:4-hydroxy-tetrahydrodipicolinate reductase n=1 Tax=Rhizosaccharibacter radicis TaxID=2782605 RepID=A0ABT1VSR2_9PROT|nr:4-hydroxy-tetrahydrodipicolinate reductase [Acetobacteraceae bacterium KSS12]
MRIGIAGINGRVGRLLVQEVVRAGAVLVGGTSRSGLPLDVPGAPAVMDVRALADECDAVIDFTHADTVRAHAAAMADARTVWVLGTTGLSNAAQEAVERAALRAPVVQAANFSPGVCLMNSLAARMAAALPPATYDAEILEMHHRQKVDAPSGTALALGRVVAEARGATLPELRDSGRDGHTGARRPGAIGFAVLRGGQVVGEHALSFTSDAEQITLEHRAFDRRVFAAGAVRAALWCAGREPGLYGMEDVLDLR